MNSLQNIAGSRAFSIGAILNRTLATLMKNPVLFIGLAVAATAPQLLLRALLPGNIVMTIIGSILSSILAAAIQAAAAYGAYRILMGGSTSVGECLSRGFRRMVPVVVAALLVGLVVGLGTLLFVVPGIILMCMLAVTMPACVVEHLGAIDAMKRSQSLTSGYRWQILGLVVIVTIAVFAIAFLVGYVVMLITGSFILSILVGGFISAIPGAFNSVMFSIIYYELRSIKEGTTLESLANVFD